MNSPLQSARALSKSKLMAFRQCPKRLWLEVHHPERKADSASARASFAVGYQVGDVAQRIYDPDTRGTALDLEKMRVAEALALTTELLKGEQPIFEAGFCADGALAFADVLLPSRQTPGAWRMIEVKSATSVKPYYRDDVAVQAYVATRSGVRLESIQLAHIDSSWIYRGGSNYAGLLVDVDFTEEAFNRSSEVERWLSDAHGIVALGTVPSRASGDHCHDPYICGFLTYCQSGEPVAEYPISLLPSARTKGLKALIADGVTELRDVPDDLLSPRQLRVKSATMTGATFFDSAGAAKDLSSHPLPAYFLDFETTQFPVPIWEETRPYQQIPFQFSIHSLSAAELLSSDGFLDLTGSDPSRRFAEALIVKCAEPWPVFVYNAAFEKSRVAELAARFPELGEALFAINLRVVDLLPVAQKRYYHPSQEGSWSIKAVLPAIAPDLSYEGLEGIKDGGGAMAAYQEAIQVETSEQRREEIRRQLISYCALDTYAMVRLWQFFMGRSGQLATRHAEAP